ncbi:MAG: UbiA family prenyltransferase [Acidobacteriota bacterium]
MAIFVGTASFFLLYRKQAVTFNLSVILLKCLSIFLLTWAISTANYIINEIVDAPFDIHHPTKKNRPLIKGEIKPIPFLLVGLILSLISLTVGFLLFNKLFFVSLLALLAAGFIYNLKPIRTKDIPFLDSISESANNPIRFLIGWFAFAPADTLPPLSLLLCWWAFGNFLMIAKRLSEYRFLKETAGDYRASLKKYSKNSLVIGMGISVLFFFVTFFYFALSFKLQSFYYLSPLLLIYFMIFFKHTLQRREVMEEPEKLLKNPLFASYTLILVIIFFISFLLDKIGV